MKKNEIFAFISSAIIMGFIFAFRQWGENTLSYSAGFYNWFILSILSLIALLFHHLGIALIAKRYYCSIEYKFWITPKKALEQLFSILRLKFMITILPFKKFYSGVIVPLILALLSNGYIKFPLTGITEIKENHAKRVKTLYKYLSEYEKSITHLAGPLANLFLALVLTSINSNAFSDLININNYLAIFTLLPIGNFNGAKILFGSKILYIFSSIFIILSVIFISIVNLWVSILLSLIIAAIFILIYLYKTI